MNERSRKERQQSNVFNFIDLYMKSETLNVKRLTSNVKRITFNDSRFTPNT